LALYFVLQTAVLPHRVLIVSALFKMPKQNYIRVIEGIINLLLSIIFVKIWGVVGILIGSILANLLCSTIFLNKLVSVDFFSSRKNSITEYKFYSIIIVLFVIYFSKNSLLIIMLVPIAFVIYIYMFYRKSSLLHDIISNIKTKYLKGKIL
jgi:hypothetical protein